MTNSLLQGIPSPVRELTGKPGQSWGNFVIPASGEVTMKISGDILETTILTSFGLDQKEIHTRIQRIETIERTEGRLWWLLWLGVPLVFAFVGIILIILFFIVKQKWIVVHNSSSNLLLFYRDSNKAKNFCNTLMAISRHLNSKSTPATSSKSRPQDRRQMQRQQRTNQQPPQST